MTNFLVVVKSRTDGEPLQFEPIDSGFIRILIKSNSIDAYSLERFKFCNTVDNLKPVKAMDF